MLDLRRAAILVAAASALLAAAWPALFLEGQIPLDGNMIAHSFPNWSVARALRPGTAAGWNPWRDLGEPFLADPQTMAVYPPMLVLRGLSRFEDFLRAWVWLHSCFAGFFLAALAFRLYGKPEAAWTAGALAALNGSFTGRVTFPNHFASAAWLPAALYFQESLSAPGVGVCLALQWLAGFPPLSIATGAVLALWAVRQGRDGIRCLFKGGAWALALGAVQWLPFVELLSLSKRKLILDSSFALQFSVPPGQLLKELLVPQWARWMPETAGDPAIVGFYVGGAAVILAVWAGVSGGRRERLLAGGAAAGLLLSLGGRLPGWSLLPFLRVFRFPANWLIPAAVLLSLLAAAGVARLRGVRARRAAAALVVLDLVLFTRAPRAAWSKPGFLSDPPAAASVVRGGDGLGRVHHARGLRALWEGGTLETADDYMVMRDFLAPSFGTAFGVSESSSYQTLRLKTAEDYLERMEAEGPRSPLADWAGITAVVSARAGAARVDRGTVGISPRPGARPRVFAADAAAARTTELDWSPGRVRARLAAARPARIVLSEMDYPGWRATVDGVPAALETFGGAFPSVRVDPGLREVEFFFRSPTIAWGAAASACALAALAALLAFEKRRS